MRWADQLIEQDEQGRLPGRIGEGVVRTFDAPEALDTRFYEVRAKSALNRVPRASRMPFEWTVNPYRGCTHACTYCADGETPILLADGRTRRLADVRPGDRIYGTGERAGRRHYALTEVLDHWATVKPAFRVSLADGTELVTSGDHRFLTREGWRHVTGWSSNRARPHLTLDSRLTGTGRFAAPPADSTEYRRGYLCGLFRGAPLGASPEDVDGADAVCAALSGPGGEALDRARRYLHVAGVGTRRISEAAAARRDDGAVAVVARPTTKASARLVRDLVAVPSRASADWCKGFLSGLFDANGGSDDGGVYLVGCEADVIEATFALDRLAFRFGMDRRGDEWRVRLHGGVAADLRFLHTVDPAVTSKRSIEGRALETSAGLAVTAIEPLRHAATLYDITTGTGDFIADGVVSHNCFARPTHEYLDLGAGRDFEREIVVKVNVPEVLRAELARPSWRRQHVAMGTNTDPYQWVEGRYKLMRGIWEALRDAANPCSILTKSPLVLRDVDLLLQIAERTEVTACLSVPTLDEKAWRASEPRTPNPRARLEAVAELNRAGIPTGILIAPLMPGINDAPEQVEEIIALAAEAGAAHIGGITLHLRGSVRKVFFDWLRGYRPDLVPRYERLYARGAYVADAERRRIEHAAGLSRGRRRSEGERFDYRLRSREPADARRSAPAEGGASQATLF